MPLKNSLPSDLAAPRPFVAPSRYPGGQKLAALGVKEPSEIADAVAEAIAEDRFLILPHPEVEQYEQNRANDRERWLGGMRKLQRHILSED